MKLNFVPYNCFIKCVYLGLVVFEIYVKSIRTKSSRQILVEIAAECIARYHMIPDTTKLYTFRLHIEEKNTENKHNRFYIFYRFS